MSIDFDFLLNNLNNAVTSVNLPPQFNKIHSGKVRETFLRDEKRIIITTDRQSAFDRILAAVPFKGQVLNQISKFWFEKTTDICPNHFLQIPDPATIIAREVEIFPIEFVIRGYITGSTDTSAWVNYSQGMRKFCGISLPNNLKKNEKFSAPILTPTTKSDQHDRLISKEEIFTEHIMDQNDFEIVEDLAKKIFARGTEIAANNGLILVDTKFEFGKDKKTGEIILADEILTPDSSRFWLESTYQSRFEKGLEPENFDKEFLRLWFVENCDPYHDEKLPDAPPELVAKLAEKYIFAFEKITGNTFVPAEGGESRIAKNLEKYFEI